MPRTTGGDSTAKKAKRTTATAAKSAAKPKTTPKPRVKKPAATKKVTTWIALVLDESSSMAPYKTKTIQAFNEYLDEQKRMKDVGDAKVTLTKFNSYVEMLQSGVPVESVCSLNESNYTPRAMTALYDALGDTIMDIDSRIFDSKEKHKILVVVFTDGEENCSRKYNANSLRELIKQKESQGNWTFSYVGIDKNSILRAQNELGIARGNTAQFNQATTDCAVKGLSLSTNSFRAAAASNSMSLYGGAATLESIADGSAALPAPAVKKSRAKKPKA